MYLTKREIEIMDVLWCAGRPLSRGEILELSVEKSWKPSTIHILLNSMLEKGVIKEAGYTKIGKTVGRLYAPTMTCEEYHISTLTSTKSKPKIGSLLSALMKNEPVSKDTLSELENIINEMKAEIE